MEKYVCKVPPREITEIIMKSLAAVDWAIYIPNTSRARLNRAVSKPLMLSQQIRNDIRPAIKRDLIWVT